MPTEILEIVFSSVLPCSNSKFCCKQKKVATFTRTMHGTQHFQFAMIGPRDRLSPMMHVATKFHQQRKLRHPDKITNVLSRSEVLPTFATHTLPLACPRPLGEVKVFGAVQANIPHRLRNHSAHLAHHQWWQRSLLISCASPQEILCPGHQQSVLFAVQLLNDESLFFLSSPRDVDAQVVSTAKWTPCTVAIHTF